MTTPAARHDTTVISAYTRGDALNDGELIDVSSTAREAGILYPVALTRAAWADLVAWSDSDGGCQDETGRLWDVVTITRMRMRQAVDEANRAGTAQIQTHLYRVPAGKENPERANMVVGLALDETASPAVTIMLPGED